MSQQAKDADHLRTLSVFHYVVGGITILFSSLFIFHIVFGIMMLRDPGFFDRMMPVPPAVSAPAATPDKTAGAAPDATPAPTPQSVHRHRQQVEFPPAFGYFAIGAGSVMILLGWTTGALLIYSGRCLARRRQRMFSMIVAGISCLQFPFGTALGIFTLIVLQRPTVQALYAAEGQR